MPDITPAQIKADVIFLVGVAGALGLKVDGDVTNGITVALVAAFAAVKAVAYLVDMLIRKHRADNAGKIIAKPAPVVYTTPAAPPPSS